MRICWETNGSESPALLRSMLRISKTSGGVLKVDFKAWNDTVHQALCGVGPEWTRRAVAEAARWAGQRPKPPLLVVSTLLVPGYVDDEEIRGIAEFLFSLDPEIPYTLLAFHPQFHMRDLSPTCRVHAERCLQAARDGGLKRVRLGNEHLLV
jgi:pyruvate formate lyase activating enzyme